MFDQGSRLALRRAESRWGETKSKIEACLTPGASALSKAEQAALVAEAREVRLLVVCGKLEAARGLELCASPSLECTMAACEALRAEIDGVLRRLDTAHAAMRRSLSASRPLALAEAAASPAASGEGAAVAAAAATALAAVEKHLLPAHGLLQWLRRQHSRAVAALLVEGDPGFDPDEFLAGAALALESTVKAATEDDVAFLERVAHASARAETLQWAAFCSARFGALGCLEVHSRHIEGLVMGAGPEGRHVTVRCVITAAHLCTIASAARTSHWTLQQKNRWRIDLRSPVDSVELEWQVAGLQLASDPTWRGRLAPLPIF
jgi:hypothetical protein